MEAPVIIHCHTCNVTSNVHLDPLRIKRHITLWPFIQQRINADPYGERDFGLETWKLEAFLRKHYSHDISPAEKTYILRDGHVVIVPPPLTTA